MTLSEVLVAAVVLGISGQVSASSWSRAAAAAGQGETLQQMLQRSDEQLLAARRLLSQSEATCSKFSVRAHQHHLARALGALADC